MANIILVRCIYIKNDINELGKYIIVETCIIWGFDEVFSTQVEFYIKQTEADNHAVREAACACIAELGLKVCIYTIYFTVMQKGQKANNRQILVHHYSKQGSISIIKSNKICFIRI